MNHIIPEGNSCHTLHLRLQMTYLVYFLLIARAFQDDLIVLMVTTKVKVVSVYSRGSMDMVKISEKLTLLILCLYK